MAEEKSGDVSTDYASLQEDNIVMSLTPLRYESGQFVSPVSIINDSCNPSQIPYDAFEEDDFPSRRRTASNTSAMVRLSEGENDFDYDFIDDEEEEILADGLPPSSISTAPPTVNGLNYLNGVTFLAHVFVSYGIGVWGLDGTLPTGWDISQRYETLITPAFWAYSLWAPILVCQALFAVCQFLPQFRAGPIIQEGTSIFFFYTCLVQTAWTLFFAFEFFIVSFVMVVLSLASLVSLLISQHVSQRGAGGGSSKQMEYWLFRFPFFLHCGWMTVMTVVHFSLIFRDFTGYLGTQLASDIVALACLMPVACFALFGTSSSPDFVVPSVIVWAYIGIASRLHYPSDDLLSYYGEDAITAFQQASYFLAGAVMCMLGPRILVWACHMYFTIDIFTLNETFNGDAL